MLAERLGRERGIGWLSTDTIRDVVAIQLPELYESVGPGEPHDPEAELFLPAFRKVVESCSYLVDDYLVEGVGFMPRHAAALALEFELRPVFVGMQRVRLDTLLATEGRNQWHRTLDAATLAIVPAWIESWSRQLEAECAPLGIPYVELADDFDAGLALAARLLLGGSA